VGRYGRNDQNFAHLTNRDIKKENIQFAASIRMKILPVTGNPPNDGFVSIIIPKPANGSHLHMSNNEHQKGMV
jgi:hypothetical protein